MRAIARMVTYMALLGAVVILPHWIAYAVVPAPPQGERGGLTIPAGSAIASLLPTVACATEDSTGCYWDASTQGNGQGKDLWN